MTSGRFDTTTKTKIKTPYGTVLKVAHYDYDFTLPDIEYKIKGVCKRCGASIGCYCFNEDKYDDALGNAIEALQFGFLCDNPQCIIRYEMDYNPENADKLIQMYGEDVKGISNAIQSTWPIWEEAPEECKV